MKRLRLALVGLILSWLTACCASIESNPRSSVAPTVSCDEATIRTAGELLFTLFNQRRLDEVMALFLADARTYYVRRGDPITREFKESGSAEIRQMISERMASGEVIQPGAIVAVPTGASTTATGTFPDGTSRRLDVKYGYDCRRQGISQLLITPIG